MAGITILVTIERDRPIRVPSLKGAFEQQLADAIRAVKLPEPVREFHFMWCCEHPKSAHRTRVNKDYRPERLDAWCALCEDDLAVFFNHAYKHERDWRFDLAWPDKMLAVEIDGGTYSGGRHTRGQGFEADCEKGNEALLRGWRVMHFTSAMVEDGRALEFVERAFGRHQ